MCISFTVLFFNVLLQCLNKWHQHTESGWEWDQECEWCWFFCLKKKCYCKLGIHELYFQLYWLYCFLTKILTHSKKNLKVLLCYLLIFSVSLHFFYFLVGTFLLCEDTNFLWPNVVSSFLSFSFLSTKATWRARYLKTKIYLGRFSPVLFGLLWVLPVLLAGWRTHRKGMWRFSLCLLPKTDDPVC